MWCEIHDDLPGHPKLSDLAARMGWSLPESVGRLVSLWLWCARYAPTGDLSAHGAHRLAGAMGVPFDDAEKLLRVLVEVRLVDSEPVLKVHDWWTYAGRYLRIRFKDQPERWKAAQLLYTSTHGYTHDLTHGCTHGATHPLTGVVTCETNQPTNQPTGPDQPDRTGPDQQQQSERKPVRVVAGTLELSTEANAVVAAWNQLGRPFAAVRAIGQDRSAALMSRCGEAFFAQNWREALGRMATSPFHRGAGRQKWVASFDWFVRADSVARLLELPEAELMDAAALARREAF